MKLLKQGLLYPMRLLKNEYVTYVLCGLDSPAQKNTITFLAPYVGFFAANMWAT